METNYVSYFIDASDRLTFEEEDDEENNEQRTNA
jgi:hypothetical protein